MKSIISALALALLMSAGNVMADAAADCAAKAIDKNGKALAGAAKDANIKKCMKDAEAPKAPAGDAKAQCEAKALDKNGKALAGAAKDANIKKCMKDAGAV